MAERKAGEVRAVQELVLGSGGEFGMVHAHERAKELGNARLPIAAFVCTRDDLPVLRLFLFRAGDIIHASEEQ